MTVAELRQALLQFGAGREVKMSIEFDGEYQDIEIDNVILGNEENVLFLGGVQ